MQPASQLLRRKAHRVDVFGRSTNVLGVCPRPKTPTSTRSKHESRTTNNLDDVVNDELLTQPELEDNRSIGVPQQPGIAVAQRLPHVRPELQELATLTEVLKKLIVKVLVLFHWSVDDLLRDLQSNARGSQDGRHFHQLFR